MTPVERVIEMLVGETIVGGDVDDESGGFHLYTRNGYVLIFLGTFGLYRTEDTRVH